MNTDISILVERATVIPFCDCRRPVAHLGAVYGKAEDDSEGQAVVLGDAGNYVAGYLTSGTYVLLAHIKHAKVESACDAAEAFTRVACE